mmetsp:Transcript_25808/g.56937  ORF Transcript_25808/g.56937 Transcript_25808/m.56937 type:complete len:300 (-) Transcript_25808:438-1337(-)
MHAKTHIRMFPESIRNLAAHQLKIVVQGQVHAQLQLGLRGTHNGHSRRHHRGTRVHERGRLAGCDWGLLHAPGNQAGVGGLAQHEHCEAEQLQPRPRAPGLPVRAGGPHLVDQEVHCPHHRRPAGLQHGSVHRGQGVGHHHPRDVEGEHREEVRKNQHLQMMTVLHHGNIVLEALHAAAVVVPREGAQDGENDKEHEDHSPNPLHADKHQGRYLDVLHQDLLHHHLRTLHRLPQNHHGHPEQSHVGILLLHPMSSVGLHHVSIPDHNYGRGTDADPEPALEGHLPFQHQNGEEGGENDY